MCDELREYEPLFRERTGLVLDPYFSGLFAPLAHSHSARPENFNNLVRREVSAG